jgi:phosphatidate cytidylyltransferase
MLRLRVLTAAIGVPLILFLFLSGDVAWRRAFLALSAMYSLWEMLALATRGSANHADATDGRQTDGRAFVRIYVFLTISSTALYLVYSGADIGLSIPTLVSSTFIASLMFLVLKLEPTVLYPMASGTMISAVWAVMPWFFMLDLLASREHLSGWLIFLLAVVWMGDTGGYFGGRFFGKHKLAPHVSPKKTIEGAVAGLLASVVSGLIVANLLEIHDQSTFTLAILSAVLGVVGQMGDLNESLLKRYVGVKDSGTILPGHGGFLDRVDGVLYAAPVLWLALRIC